MTILRRPDVRQEEDVVPWRRILLVGFAVIVLCLLLVLWAAVILRSQIALLRPSGLFPERELGPRRPVSGVQQELFLDVGPGEALSRWQRRQVDSFGWDDRDRALVRIPVEDAMRLLVEEQAR